MPAKSGRSTEQDIAIAAMRYLATTQSGEATIFAIKANADKFITFTPDDLETSETRPHECMWEQQVRNIVSHRNNADNFVHGGLLEYRPRRLAITDAGRAWLKKKGY